MMESHMEEQHSLAHAVRAPAHAAPVKGSEAALGPTSVVTIRRMGLAQPQSRNRKWVEPLHPLLTFCRRKPLGAVGGLMLSVLLSIAILAPLISPHDPYHLNAQHIYAPPNTHMPMGADHVGRDVMSRLFYGARISLFVGFASVGVGITLGALLGLLSAYIGGTFDLIVQRLVDALMAFPAIILALGIMAVLGASLTNVILALIIVLAPSAVRTVRSQALSVQELEYIQAARAIGCSHWRILFSHIMPNCVGIFIVLATISLRFAIITEASLSFLGVGVPPDVPTWGGMLAKGGGRVCRGGTLAGDLPRAGTDAGGVRL